MENNIRIYYNKQRIYMTSNANELIKDEALRNAWIIRKVQSSEMKKAFITFSGSDFDNLLFEGDPENLLHLFQKNFKTIVAGGGVVWNELDELLMIYRLSKWDLPKGKLDLGEEIEACAVREVEEETGIQNIELIKHLKTSFHIYSLKNRWIIKQTEWYEMEVLKQKLVPQSEEDISHAVWLSRTEVEKKLLNSYPNIITLLEDVL